MDGPKTAIKRGGECYGCHVKELESARVTRRRKTTFPTFAEVSLSRLCFYQLKESLYYSLLNSTITEHYSSSLFLWANIRQDRQRENIIIIVELKQSSLQ